MRSKGVNNAYSRVSILYSNKRRKKKKKCFWFINGMVFFFIFNKTLATVFIIFLANN